MYLFSILLCDFIVVVTFSEGISEVAWSGGPLHVECEHAPEMFISSRHHLPDNVIVTKAVTYKSNIYVLSPRFKPGVLSTIWQLVNARKGVELQPYPDLRTHTVADCLTLQNAVDFYLDHFGNLWILDSGIVESAYNPRCTCSPKVVVISLLWDKVTRQIDISTIVTPTSTLQNIVVEYDATGNVFVYITDASRGAVLVYDTSSSAGWSVVASAPSAGLQMVMTKAHSHCTLVIARLPYAGLIELDTAALRRRDTYNPLRIFAEQSTPVLLLGSNGYHVYLRLMSGPDACSWDARSPYNESKLHRIYSPPSHLTTTSVFADHLLHKLVVLDTNYAESVHTDIPTYHKIRFIDLFLV